MDEFVMSGAADQVGARIAEAIGGRDRALRFSAASNGRFSRQTIQRWIDGETSPDITELSALAVLTGRTLAWFLGIEAAPAAPLDLVYVPRLNVEVAAGEGRLIDVATAVSELPFPREFVERMAPRGADLQCLQVRGDSMAPAIQDGALIIIDHKQVVLPKWRPEPRKTPKIPQKRDAIYVFNHSGLVRLKRLRDLGEEFIAIISDNGEAHPPEIIRRGRDGGFKVLGKVVWWDVRG